MKQPSIKNQFVKDLSEQMQKEKLGEGLENPIKENGNKDKECSDEHYLEKLPKVKIFFFQLY